MEIEIGVKKYTIYYHYPYYFHSKDFDFFGKIFVGFFQLSWFSVVIVS
jgi:hypothetical protein